MTSEANNTINKKTKLHWVREQTMEKSDKSTAQIQKKQKNTKDSKEHKRKRRTRKIQKSTKGKIKVYANADFVFRTFRTQGHSHAQ